MFLRSDTRFEFITAMHQMDALAATVEGFRSARIAPASRKQYHASSSCFLQWLFNHKQHLLGDAFLEGFASNEVATIPTDNLNAVLGPPSAFASVVLHASNM